MHKDVHILITCEHGGNSVPERYRKLFQGKKRLLESHRGYDPGSLKLAQDLSAALGADLVYSTMTRLLVDMNRSEHNAKLFSEITRGLSVKEKAALLQRYYLPYRTEVKRIVTEGISSGRSILHVSVHSFTLRYNGKVRQADVGFLYHPSRQREKEFCSTWKEVLGRLMPELRIRMNYPYRGVTDGLATSLRASCSSESYTGIELEVNQALMSDGKLWREFRNKAAESLKQAMGSVGKRHQGELDEH